MYVLLQERQTLAAIDTMIMLPAQHTAAQVVSQALACHYLQSLLNAMVGKRDAEQRDAAHHGARQHSTAHMALICFWLHYTNHASTAVIACKNHHKMSRSTGMYITQIVLVFVERSTSLTQMVTEPSLAMTSNGKTSATDRRRNAHAGNHPLQ